MDSVLNCGIDGEKLKQFKTVSNALDFTGKVVLVTGAAGGIGGEIVRLFAHLGAQVILTDINEEALKKVSEECHQLSPKKIKPFEVVADLTDKEEVEQIVMTGVNTFGKLDILVNVAAILTLSFLTDDHYEDVFAKTQAINLEAFITLTRCAVPYLKQTKGTIINMSSISKNQLIRGISAYTMTKAAIDQLTRTLALELGPDIRVNCISPGLILGTDLTRLPEEAIDRVISHTPMRRKGTPLDVAKGVVFLASPLAEWITAADLPITGGMFGDLNFV